MTDLKKGEQRAGGITHPTGGEDDNRGAEFGTSEKATRGTDRDADRTGESKNQGHGHPREERSE